MFKEKKYFGEVWFERQESKKEFCELEIIDEDVIITTKLIDDEEYYRVDIIYGTFAGLGYLTFINCKIIFSSFGVVPYKKYLSEFTFSCGYHHIIPNKLQIDKFSVGNASIVKWLINQHHYDYYNKKFIKRENLSISGKIDSDLEYSLLNTTTSISKIEYFKMSNDGYITFKRSKRLSITECIELYQKFENFLHYFLGESEQFSSFNFNCPDCDELIDFYYKSKLCRTRNSGFLRFSFKEIKDDFNNLMITFFNNYSIYEIAEIIVENQINKPISHKRRFLNSYTAFELYSSQFLAVKNKPKIEKCLMQYLDLISFILDKNQTITKIFIKKIVRHRDFLAHRNRPQNNFFSDFELFYLSYLLDYVTTIQILKKIELSSELIEKVKSKAKRFCIDVKGMNEILNKNYLN